MKVTALHASLASPASVFEANQLLIVVLKSVPSHSKLKSLGSFIHVGSVLSPTLRFAVLVVKLPQSSVAVKTTMVSPVKPQSSPLLKPA